MLHDAHLPLTQHAVASVRNTHSPAADKFIAADAQVGLRPKGIGRQPNTASVVRAGGFEPPRSFEHGHLKTARLPFRHARNATGVIVSISGMSDGSPILLESLPYIAGEC